MYGTQAVGDGCLCAAGAQALIVHEWKESFKKGDTTEQDTGDIASA
jgi:hypothetical protein